MISSIAHLPVFRVKSEAEAVSDTSCSPLPLEGAGFGNKSFHQRTHLAAFMVPEHSRLDISLPNFTKVFPFV